MLKYLTILLALVTPAQAQQQLPPQGTPLEQALGNKLMQEINENVGLRAQIIQLQKQVKAAEDAAAHPKPLTPEPPGEKP